MRTIYYDGDPSFQHVAEDVVPSLLQDNEIKARLNRGETWTTRFVDRNCERAVEVTIQQVRWPNEPAEEG
jgi:hypothetical protein